MQPTNLPISGGVLRIPQVASPDFVTGTSGWIIRQDGTAEFNEVTVRGPVIIGNPPSVGARELGLTQTSTPAIPAVLTGFNVAYTWYLADIYWINTTDFFFGALVNNSTFTVVEWITGIYTLAAGVQIQTLTEGSTPNTLNYGSSVYDTAKLVVSWRNATMVIDSSSTLDDQGDWSWHSKSGGYAAAAASTAANVLTTSSVADVALLTLPSATYSNGFVYAVEIGIQASGTGGNNSAVYALRKGTIAGTRFLEFRAWHAIQGSSTSNNDHCTRAYFFNNTGADITTALVLAVKLNAATSVQFGGGSINPIYANVRLDRSYTAATAPEAVALT